MDGSIKISGGNDEKDTPVPIPNTAVKLLSADDTWLVTARESRSLPDLYQASVVYPAEACFSLRYTYTLFFKKNLNIKEAFFDIIKFITI